MKNKKNFVSFKEIKSQVSIEQVLSHYGLIDKLKRRGDNLIGPCPLHQGTNPNQFHVSLIKNNFNCFGDCHQGGNIIDFVCAIEGLDRDNPKEFRQAALMIQEWFLSGPVATDPQAASSAELVKEEPATTGQPAQEQLANKKLVKEKKKWEKTAQENVAASVVTPKRNPALKFTLKNLEPDHPYLLERGLEKLTVQFFGLGFCSKGMMSGRIAIPIHNPAGELVAYAGRWPGDPPEEEAKYKLPPGFHKSLELFNFHRAKEFARDQGLILVEGFFDCVRVWQAGFQNVVSLLGSQLSEKQEKLIVEAVGPGGRVALMFDEDAAGWACRDEVLERLVSQVYVKVIRLGDEGLQPDGLTKEDIKRLLA